MKKIYVVVGMEPDWDEETKQQICSFNGLDIKNTMVYSNLDGQREQRKKEMIDEILGKVKYSDQAKATIFTNSDSVLQWVNNAILLDKVKNEQLEKETGMVSLSEQIIESYEFDPELNKLEKNDFGEYGFEYRKLNEALVDLFQASITIQEEMEQAAQK